jgi:pyrroloquinoline-quinone synthase
MTQSQPEMAMHAESWTKAEFERRLRDKERYYHIHHPFHVQMNSGQMNKEAVQGWVANRFYYQTSIPVKDAAILANCRDRTIRREWIQRIIDHDGTGDDPGGIEAWLQLGDAVGLPREDLLSERHVLPGVRFAVDAYVNFARRASWQEAACSSLTELFAPTIHQRRLENWPQHYPWIKAEGYAYFRKRLAEARRDVEHGLAITLDYFRTREQQEHALTILQFKLDILWTMLDAMWMAYIEKKPPYFTVAPSS